MKDTHLIIALYRALDRYGTTALPDDDADRTERGRGGRWHEDRRRSPGWVSIGEIEACQSPNTYPRLTKRAIRMRCEALSREEGSPVRGVEKPVGGLRTWVLVTPPGDRAGDAGRGTPTDASADPASDRGERGPENDPHGRDALRSDGPGDGAGVRRDGADRGRPGGDGNAAPGKGGDGAPGDPEEAARDGTDDDGDERSRAISAK